MTAIVLVVGAASSSILLAAIVLDWIVSARASEPAPRQFSLFLRLFLFFQMVAFVPSTAAAELTFAPESWRTSPFILEWRPSSSGRISSSRTTACTPTW